VVKSLHFFLYRLYTWTSRVARLLHDRLKSEPSDLGTDVSTYRLPFIAAKLHDSLLAIFFFRLISFDQELEPKSYLSEKNNK
jgi:hypothetical protein